LSSVILDVGGVPKNPLGRGLRELLPERNPTPERKAKDSTDLGPGLRVLVLQKNGGTQRSAAPEVQRSGNHTAVKVSLLLADILLASMTVLWQRGQVGRLELRAAALCVLAICFAAWLGCLAGWLHFRRE
jgi:hypothetical protein